MTCVDKDFAGWYNCRMMKRDGNMTDKLLEEFFNCITSEGEMLQLIENLCKIPAPSLYEEKRALFKSRY